MPISSIGPAPDKAMLFADKLFYVIQAHFSPFSGQVYGFGLVSESAREKIPCMLPQASGCSQNRRRRGRSKNP